MNTRSGIAAGRARPLVKHQVRTRITVATLVVLFAVAGGCITASNAGPKPGWPLVTVCVVLVSTIPVSVLMWQNRRAMDWVASSVQRSGVATVFTVYADIGVTIVLALLRDHEAALYGTALFAVVSTYVAFFATAQVAVAHTVFTSAVVAVFAVRLSMDPAGLDTWAVVARGLVVWLAINHSTLVINKFSSHVSHSLLDRTRSADTDPLTGILNLRGFYFRAEARLTHNPGPFICLLVDIDHFKQVNDNHGHAAGDAVLILATQRLLAATPRHAIIARRGGEEFVIIVPSGNGGIVDSHAAETTRIALHNPADLIPITASIGYITLANPADSATAPASVVTRAMDLADQAMFIAKKAGRNCTRTLPTDNTNNDARSRQS